MISEHFKITDVLPFSDFLFTVAFTKSVIDIECPFMCYVM